MGASRWCFLVVTGTLRLLAYIHGSRQLPRWSPVDQPSGTITLKVKEGTMAHLYPPSCKVLLHLIYGLRWRTVDRTEMHAWSVIRTRVNIIAIINGTPTKRTKAM
jgi:hypothetical protein